MPRIYQRLTARKVATLTEPGLYADGDGLYLQITKGGVKSWIYRFRHDGRRSDMGLGPLRSVSLAQARDAASAAASARRSGLNPLSERQAARAESQAVPKFWAYAQAYIEEQAPGWTNPKHVQQWTNTLKTYAVPVIGDKRIDRIDTDDMLAVLRPIWPTKTETASRVRQRIEKILGAATVQKLRSGDNPARWKGHLDMLLPKPTDVAKVSHFNALPVAEMPAFIAVLRSAGGSAARALEFTILTASRTGMAIGAMPSEIDLATATWEVPAERMKSGRPHLAPLPSRAIELLHGRMDWPLIFPSNGTFAPMSENAMLAVLKRTGYAHVTVHGFRSTFKTWADEAGYPDDLSEAALAHVVSDKAKAAYKRGTMLERRREMMQTWADFLASGCAARRI